jgi:hypothetical protein
VFQNYTSVCDLLVQAGLLDVTDAAQAANDSRDKGLTPGEYLTSFGGVSPTLIRAAILSMLLTHDKLLPTATAIMALQLMHKDKLSYEEALEKAGFKKGYFEHVRLICSLLQRSDCISAQDREVAYEICTTHELPVVQVLIKRGAINDLIGDVVLVVEKLLAQDVLSYEQAVQTLAESKSRQVGADEALQTLGHENKLSKNLRLGELLLAAGIVTAHDLLGAVESALYKKQFMGEALVEKSLLTNQMLQAALSIQQRINEETISPTTGVDQLKQMKYDQGLI